MTGQQAYEEDVKRCPFYHDGTPRKAWQQLDEAQQWSWNRNHFQLTPTTRRPYDFCPHS
ncbi:hypothetical protein [Pseudophaeobacter sp.]|uniref:hypothetical protein n=1 Tax=Pseudophaeobacter sp. TaxID=1971739 RepID=UPI004059D984